MDVKLKTISLMVLVAISLVTQILIHTVGGFLPIILTMVME